MHPVGTRVLINKKYFRSEIYATVICCRRHEEIIQEFTRNNAHTKYAAARAAATAAIAAAAVAAATVAVATVAVATVTAACGQLSLVLLIM